MIETDPSKLLIAVAAGSGQVARVAIDAGADLLLVLNAGRYRSLGTGSLASFLPYGNANHQTLELLRDILPAARTVPVVAGVLGTDPEIVLDEHLDRLCDLGVAGVTNWPSLGFIDGRFRLALEEEGITPASEVATLAAARAKGLTTIAFVHTEADAALFAPVSDGMILNIGLTHEIDARQDHRDQIQAGISRLNAMRSAARRINPAVFCLMFGGIVTTAQDFESVLVRCDIDGFAGGSVFERLPIQPAVEATIRQFRYVARCSPAGGASANEGPLIGETPVMRELRSRIARIAPFDVNVCIEGETGTGKELVAAEIHRLSTRRGAPFITLNCGAMTDSLLESELFGYEKGAFTGADRRHIGKFERAHGGTLFLDEVADLTPRAQVALLRAIQQGEVLRIGSEKPLHVDVRIVTATHFDLRKRVDEGLFRADLYFRLNQMPLRVPPLAERLDDLGHLTQAILSRIETRIGRRLAGITSAFERRLRTYPWPGNVRELEFVLCRAAILEDGQILKGTTIELPPAPSSSGTPRGETLRSPPGKSSHERAKEALERAEGNKTQAALDLGVSRKTLYSWLRGG
jgi:two-component system response regulator HydG